MANDLGTELQSQTWLQAGDLRDHFLLCVLVWDDLYGGLSVAALVSRLRPSLRTAYQPEKHLVALPAGTASHSFHCRDCSRHLGLVPRCVLYQRFA